MSIFLCHLSSNCHQDFFSRWKQEVLYDYSGLVGFYFDDKVMTSDDKSVKTQCMLFNPLVIDAFLGYILNFSIS